MLACVNVCIGNVASVDDFYEVYCSDSHYTVSCNAAGIDGACLYNIYFYSSAFGRTGIHRDSETKRDRNNNSICNVYRSCIEVLGNPYDFHKDYWRNSMKKELNLLPLPLPGMLFEEPSQPLSILFW
ncbi:MAG: hypothetical protein JKY62_03565 [Desulfocapsa sp.]|nr:hypothetical protein [Desulfocapsa sp.]